MPATGASFRRSGDWIVRAPGTGDSEGLFFGPEQGKILPLFCACKSRAKTIGPQHRSDIDQTSIELQSDCNFSEIDDCVSSGPRYSVSRTGNIHQRDRHDGSTRDTHSRW